MGLSEDIRITGDPVLEAVCEPVGEVTDEVRELAGRMLDTMYEAEGCGLAAPQVGELKRLVVIDVDWANGERNPFVLIDPVIVEASEETRPYNEGCLSFPGVTVEIDRPRHVVVHARNLDGDLMEYDAADSLLAVCLQHELDHLDGKTLLDHLGPMGRMRLKQQVKRAIEEGAKPGDVDAPKRGE